MLEVRPSYELATHRLWVLGSLAFQTDATTSEHCRVTFTGTLNWKCPQWDFPLRRTSNAGSVQGGSPAVMGGTPPLLGCGSAVFLCAALHCRRYTPASAETLSRVDGQSST